MGHFNRDSRNSSSRPKMHKAICSECGANCELPFRPSGGRPVFCSSCFEKQNGGVGDRRSNRYNEDRRDRRSSFRDKSMHDAICVACGEKCQVPFKPTPGKDIYCSNCFDKKGSTNKVASSLTNNVEYTEHLDAIHTKLNMIMNALGLDSTKKEKAKKQVTKKVVKKKIEKKEVKKSVVKKTIKSKKPVKKTVVKKKTAKKPVKKNTKVKTKKATKKTTTKKKIIKKKIIKKKK